ncbi:hypothetical protein LINGRAHAP2_LOCUS14946 [Linum grandiflorum]
MNRCETFNNKDATTMHFCLISSLNLSLREELSLRHKSYRKRLCFFIDRRNNRIYNYSLLTAIVSFIFIPLYFDCQWNEIVILSFF